MKKISVVLGFVFCTVLLKAQTETIEFFAEIVPGSYYSSVDEFFEWEEKGIVIFAANDDVNGKELWISDGTTEGTYMLKDIFPGLDYWDEPNSSYPEYFCLMGDYVYFRAFHPDYGFELFRTDGTEEGTTMVADIFPGNGDGMSLTNKFGVYNDEIYFQAQSDLSSRVELWKSDGTSDGTVMVKDINSTELESSHPHNFIVFNDLLYFIAETEPNHHEIYFTDGTELGTQRMSTLPVEESLNVYELFYLNEMLIFKAIGNFDLELYASDGTHDGTFLLRDINTDGGSMPQLHQMIVFNNEMYFQAYSPDIGSELWKTDGTTDGTVLVKDINTGYDGYALSSSPRSFAVFDDKLFFMADDGENGFELWISDGTTDGTQMYSDINPGVGGSWADLLTNCNNKLYFAANDGEDYKLMSINSSSSEVVIHTCNEFEYSGNSGFSSLFVINDKLHFHAMLESDKGWELYKLIDEEPNFESYIHESKINIFPNPTKNFFVIDNLEEEFIINIYTIDGKYIKSIINEQIVSTADMQVGTYILEIILKDNFKTLKLIKE